MQSKRKAVQSFTVKAPTRADLAGGTLDLWPLYCVVENSQTINVALDLYAQARFESEPGSKFSLRLSDGASDPITIDRPIVKAELEALSPQYRFGAFVLSRYLAARGALPQTSVTVNWTTSVPVGSGLGGSSALCVSLARGISRLFGDYIEQGWQWKMLEWVRDVEASFLSVPTGTQDYLAALFGGMRSYSSSLGVRDELSYDSEVLDQLASRMVILYSGEQHNSGLSNWEIYKKAIDGDTETIAGLGKIGQIAVELDRQLRSPTSDTRWTDIGSLLGDEWRVRKHVFGVHTPRLDQIFDFLKSQNVLGAKVCGAASGGSLLVLTRPEERAAVVRACEKSGISVLAARPVRRGVGIEVHRSTN